MEQRLILAVMLFLLVLPFTHAWILPHQVNYYVSPGDMVKSCATVLLDHNATVSLTCGSRVVGEANVLAGAPAVLCYTFSATSSQTCTWSDGSDSERIAVHVDYGPVVDAILALLLIVLVVRFTVKLVRIYI